MKRPIRFGTAVLLAAALSMAIPSAADAAVYVKWNSPGPTFDGRSWETAHHMVQASLDAAISGEEVWVAAGTYVEGVAR